MRKEGDVADDGGHCVKSRVVVVLPFPPAADFRRKFFVDELIAAGIAVEYWDVGPIMRYRPGEHADQVGLTYRRFVSLRQLRAAVNTADGEATGFVLQITRGPASFRLYRVFAQTAGTLIFFGRGYLPTPSPERSPRALVRKLVRAPDVRSVGIAVTSRLLGGRAPFTRPYDLVFAAGAVARRRHKADAVDIVDVHHFDLDAAMQEKRAGAASPTVPGESIVFIDDYLPGHPDFVSQGARTLEPDRYYCALNGFFDRVEGALGVPVLIAAHPRAEYRNNPFGGRRIVTGATPALVRRASLVLAHASTAIALAVISERPLCILTNDDVARTHPYLHRLMGMTAEALSCPLMNMDAPLGAVDTIARVDRARYATYAREYLSAVPRDTSSAEIVVHELRRRLRPSGAPITDAWPPRAVVVARP